jgi:ABC-type antimicrobial peptide transport system permease subunit
MSLLADVRHTIRQLRQAPGFTIATVLTFTVALDVAQRQGEFAIRSALGASHEVILRGVLVRAGWRVAAGTALGVVVALGAGRALQGLLYGVAPLDAVTYAVALSLLFAATAIAAFVPARRIGRIEPQALLRQE